MHRKPASLKPTDSPKPAMKVEYPATSHSSFHLPKGLTIACDETKKLLSTEDNPFSTVLKVAPWLVTNQNCSNRQQILHGHTTTEPPNSDLRQGSTMTHPEGHCDQFPAPPKAWECCGCKQKFYNFEKQCNFCATLYCKDCKTIPWK